MNTYIVYQSDGQGVCLEIGRFSTLADATSATPPGGHVELWDGSTSSTVYQN